MKYFKQFGGRFKDSHKKAYARSSRWIKGKFRNARKVSFRVKPWHILKFLYERMFHRARYCPPEPIEVMPFDREKFLAASDHTRFIWYGHSVLLLRINGLTVLIDPMFGRNASPVAPIRTLRYSENVLPILEEIPDPDLVLISHDHYDHLDYESIERIKDRVGQFYVAMGVGRHLESWGISPDRITEFDWWEEKTFKGIEVTLTPTQHFSGRTLGEKAKSFWGGWALRTQKENIWFSGDGGYNDHFKEIGQRLGPFDLAFMECGQYSKHWKVLHMFPEESVQAALDAGVKKAMPVHWASFTLSMHHWKEPIERFVREAEKKGLEIIHPQLGQLCSAEDGCEVWWEEME